MHPQVGAFSFFTVRISPIFIFVRKSEEFSFVLYVRSFSRLQKLISYEDNIYY